MKMFMKNGIYFQKKVAIVVIWTIECKIPPPFNSIPIPIHLEMLNSIPIPIPHEKISDQFNSNSNSR